MPWLVKYIIIRTAIRPIGDRAVEALFPLILALIWLIAEC